uniref:Uncharacterized protein n=1 Tax=Junco hyemalis TaxID=40217 RepID=A0A8C5IK97_JUNHY
LLAIALECGSRVSAPAPGTSWTRLAHQAQPHFGRITSPTHTQIDPFGFPAHLRVFPQLLVSLSQCWSRKNGHLLCAEHCPGEGEGRGHPRCLSDSQEFKTTEATHGADTGRCLLPRQNLSKDGLGAQCGAEPREGAGAGVEPRERDRPRAAAPQRPQHGCPQGRRGV